MSTYDEYTARYTQAWTPSPESVPADHWSKTVDEKDLEKRIEDRLAAGNTVQSLAPNSAHASGVRSSHDIQMAACVVEYGEKPQPDKDKVAEHNRKRADDARRAKAERAAPTGPRVDEKDGWVPDGTTTGEKNPESSGCVPVEWKPPVGGRWVKYGMNGAERFVPDPAPEFSPVEKPTPVPVQTEPERKYVPYESSTPTSKLGHEKPKNKHAGLATGPAPVMWTDPAEKK